MVIDLRADPFEHVVGTGASYGYQKWLTENFWAMVPAQAIVKRWVETFKEFPPRQAPAKFSVSDALTSMSNAHSAASR
jgi:hypothetical protein